MVSKWVKKVVGVSFEFHLCFWVFFLEGVIFYSISLPYVLSAELHDLWYCISANPRCFYCPKDPCTLQPARMVFLCNIINIMSSSKRALFIFQSPGPLIWLSLLFNSKEKTKWFVLLAGIISADVVKSCRLLEINQQSKWQCITGEFWLWYSFLYWSFSLSRYLWGQSHLVF